VRNRPFVQRARSGQSRHASAKDRLEPSAVVAPEVGDGLEVGLQVPQQPDHLDVAAGLGFQPPAGAHPVQVAVDVELQQVGRRIPRPARRLRLDPDEPGRREGPPVHERIDEPHRVVGVDVVVHRFREQQGLRAVMTGDVRHSGNLPAQPPRRNPSSRVFTRSGWIVERTFGWLGRCRRLAKDFEALTRTHLAFVQLAMIRLMMRRIARASQTS
jgi:transposase